MTSLQVSRVISASAECSCQSAALVLLSNHSPMVHRIFITAANVTATVPLLLILIALVWNCCTSKFDQPTNKALEGKYSIFSSLDFPFCPGS